MCPFNTVDFLIEVIGWEGLNLYSVHYSFPVTDLCFHSHVHATNMYGFYVEFYFLSNKFCVLSRYVWIKFVFSQNKEIMSVESIAMLVDFIFSIVRV
jgi:hypothetical protein